MRWKSGGNDGRMVLLLRILVHERDMSFKAPQISFKFKSNPRTIKYIMKNSETVGRAIIQADIIFPTSSLAPDGPEYGVFKYNSFWKLDGIIRRVDPTVSETSINTLLYA
jgi:hypothetical protein